MPASMSDPADGGQAVTTGDTAADNFSRAARSLYVGTGGAVTVVLKSGSTLAFANVPDGSVLPVECVRVNATGTDASDIVALW